MIQTDAPIDDVSLDILKRWPLAIKIAELIKVFWWKESIVIGIEWPWWSWKTSFMNLVLKQISGDVFLMKFNPWNFTNQNELITDFFSSLQAVLIKNGSKALTKTLGRYAGKLKWKANPKVTFFGFVEVEAWDVFKKSNMPLETERNNINRELSKLPKKIVIVIDDIDRLDKDETRLIMKLVKMTANFPNTIFLLAYDRQRVVERLEEDGWPGEEYLKKIIQVSFTLPNPDRQGLDGILINDINETIKIIYGSMELSSDDQKRWNDLLYAWMNELFQTIRDIKRFSSSLRLNSSIIGKEEVNMLDFIAVEVIRVFAPAFYNSIAGNKTFFTNSDPFSLGAIGRDATKTQEERKQKYNSFLSKVPEEIREIINKMTQNLFPQLLSTNHGSDWHSEWRTERRVCSEERFWFYFQLGIPEWAVSEVEIKNLIDNINDLATTEWTLLAFNADKRIRAALAKVLDKINDLNEEKLANLIVVLWNIGDQVNDERRVMFDFHDVATQIRRIIHFGIEKIVPKVSRWAFLTKIVEESTSLYLPTRAIGWYYHDIVEKQKKADGTEPLVNESDLAPSKAILFDRIKQKAQDWSLPTEEYFLFFLYWWKEWEGIEAVKKYVRTLIQTKKGLLTYIKSWASKVLSTQGDYKQSDKKSLELFIDAEELKIAIEWITEADLSGATEDEKEALQIYKDPKERW